MNKSSKNKRIEVYNDTMYLCRKNEQLKSVISHSVKQQEIILEKTPIAEVNKKKYDKPAEIIVSSKRSFEAAANYKGLKTCVHNFASATTPGGGVINGSSAQEECLCRISTLYPCLDVDRAWDTFYIPHRQAKNTVYNDDCIYTPGVAVIKTDTELPALMLEEDWYAVDVVTCAAPNLRGMMFKLPDKELALIHEKRAQRMLDIIASKGAEVVVLGAFGCGAFENNPEVVASVYKEVISDYMHTFRVIEFAVYCPPDNVKNYEVFKKIFEEK